MNNQKYWYGIDGERLGPVSLADIQAMVREGRLRPTDYIWNEQHEVWTRVTDFLSGIGDGRTASPRPSGDAGFEGTTGPPDESDADFEHGDTSHDWGAAAGKRYGSAYVHEDSEFGYASATQQTREFAGFWIRLGAHIIDSFVLGAAGLVWFIFASMLGWMDAFLALDSAVDPTDFSAYLDSMPWSFWLGGFVISWIYEAGFISSSWMATPGKKLMGIVVVNYEGERCGFGQATLRIVMKTIFTQMTGGLAYLAIAFTEKKQGVHDLIAQTYCEKL